MKYKSKIVLKSYQSSRKMDEIKKFEDYKKRLEKLEKAVFGKKEKTTQKLKSDYSGLVGGIQLLVDNGFFSNPKLLKEIVKELKVKNYHYSQASVSKILARDFVRKKRILNRIKEGVNYKYVIRK